MSPNSSRPTAGARTKSTAAKCFMEVVAKDAEEYAAEHTSPLSELLEEIERFTLTETAYPSMLTGRVEGRFLQMAVQLVAAKNIVEIGTFTGYSALAMAEMLPADGRVTTIEHDRQHAEIAQNFFNRSTIGHKVTIRVGEALDVLKTLPDEATDLVFIDADKQNYIAYYQESMRIVRQGGVILADNALWYGKVLAPNDEESRAMADFNAVVRDDDRTEKLFLTLRDGIYLIRKCM